MNKKNVVFLAIALTVSMLAVARYSRYASNYPGDLRDAVASPESSQSADFSDLQALKGSDIKAATDAAVPVPSAVKAEPLPFRLNCDISVWGRGKKALMKETFIAATEEQGVVYASNAEGRKAFYNVRKIKETSGWGASWIGYYRLSVEFDKRSDNLVLNDGSPVIRDGLPSIMVFFSEKDDKIQAISSMDNELRVSCDLVK